MQLLTSLLLRSDGVLVSVEATRGSAPRDAGAWMAVFAQAVTGTIGGGHLELQAIEEARRRLAGGTGADVLYGGDEPGAVPSRKALALTRLADPHLPFVAVSPNVRRGDLSSIVRGLDDAAMVISDPRELAPRLSKELDAARLRRRVHAEREA